MPGSYTTDHHFEKLDFTQAPLPTGEYESCAFTACEFSGTTLAGLRFVDCTFTACNLSNATLTQTVFRDATFKSCKMLGMRFDDCSAFGLSFRFEDCVLNHSSFYGTVIKKTVFHACRLHEVDFSRADLTSSSFDGCDFAGASLNGTNLEKTDFRYAVDYTLDPEANRAKEGTFFGRWTGGAAGEVRHRHRGLTCIFPLPFRTYRYCAPRVSISTYPASPCGLAWRRSLFPRVMPTCYTNVLSIVR